MSAHQRFILKRLLSGPHLPANLLGTIARVLPRRAVVAVAPWRAWVFPRIPVELEYVLEVVGLLDPSREVSQASIASMNRSGEETSPLVSSI